MTDDADAVTATADAALVKLESAAAKPEPTAAAASSAEAEQEAEALARLLNSSSSPAAAAAAPSAPTAAPAAAAPATPAGAAAAAPLVGGLSTAAPVLAGAVIGDSRLGSSSVRLTADETAHGKFLTSLRGKRAAALKGSDWTPHHEAVLTDAVTVIGTDMADRGLTAALTVAQCGNTLFSRVKRDARFAPWLGGFSVMDLRSKWGNMCETNELDALAGPQVFGPCIIPKLAAGDRARLLPFDAPLTPAIPLIPPMYGPDVGCCDSDTEVEDDEAAAERMGALRDLCLDDREHDPVWRYQQLKTKPEDRETPQQRAAVSAQMLGDIKYYYEHRKDALELGASIDFPPVSEAELAMAARTGASTTVGTAASGVAGSGPRALATAASLPLLDGQSAAPTLLRSDFGNAVVVRSSYAVKSLKTYLVNVAGMPLATALALLRLLLETPAAGPGRRLALAAALAAHFQSSATGRDRFRRNVRGGVRHVDTVRVPPMVAEAGAPRCGCCGCCGRPAAAHYNVCVNQAGAAAGAAAAAAAGAGADAGASGGVPMSDAGSGNNNAVMT